jgi:hypothetical protein
MEKVKAENVKVGLGLKLWFGKHTVVRILPYTGPFDFIINIMEFSNGSKMSNEKNSTYELVGGFSNV